MACPFHSKHLGHYAVAVDGQDNYPAVFSCPQCAQKWGQREHAGRFKVVPVADHSGLSVSTGSYLAENTAPGSADRIIARLLFEAKGNIRSAFERLVAEHSLDDHLWFIFLHQAAEHITSESPVSLSSEPAPPRPEVSKDHIEPSERTNPQCLAVRL